MKKFVGLGVLTFILVLILSLFLLNYKKSDISIYRLRNGQTVVIKEVKGNPIFTIDTWGKTGSIDENDANNGVAHFLEHLFFKGTKNRKQGEFEKALDSYGADYNAATSMDYTHFYITAPKDKFDQVLDFHSDMLLNMNIPKESLDRERKVVQEEIRRSMDNPDSKVFSNLDKLLYKQHPYRRDVIGTEQIIQNIPRQEIIDFYNNNYTPENIITVVVGDVNKDEVIKKIEKKFSQKKHKKTQRQKHPKEPKIKQQRESIEKGNYTTGYMLIGFRGVDIRNKRDNVALDVTAEILGDGKTSRLYKKIKDELNLADSISSSHISMKEDSVFVIRANFKPENYDLLKRAIFKEIQRLDNVSDEELERAKTKLKKTHMYSNESVEDIAQEIGYNMVVAGNLDYYENYDKNVDNITTNDIKRVVKDYLQPSQAAISVLLPQNAVISTLQREKYKNITKTSFGNGLVLINEGGRKNDIVSLNIFVKGGAFAENIPGTSNLLATMLLKGTKTKTEDELSKEIEDLGIILHPSASSEYFKISLQCTTEDFEQAFEILKDVFMNPVFANDKLAITKQNMLQSIRQSRDLPASRAFESFNTLFYKGNPYGYTGEVLEKTIPFVKKEDLETYHTKYFNPANMIVSVSGNIDTEDLIDKMSYFQNNDRAVKFDMKKIQATKVSPDFKFQKIPSPVNTAWLIRGWKVPGIRNRKEHASLRLVSAILGEGMSSRLFSNLREKEGLAYEISSVYPAKIADSALVIYIGTAPNNFVKAMQGFDREIKRIKTEKISETELESAKNRVIGTYLLSQETNDERANYLGWWEITGEGYKFIEEYPDIIKKVSVDDIIKASKKYLNDANLTVLVAPAGK